MSRMIGRPCTHPACPWVLSVWTSVFIHTVSPSLAYWSQPSSSPLPGLRSMSLFQFLLIIACGICFLLVFFLTLYSLLWAGTFFLRKMRETMAMMKAGSSWCLRVSWVPTDSRKLPVEEGEAREEFLTMVPLSLPDIAPFLCYGLCWTEAIP